MEITSSIVPQIVVLMLQKMSDNLTLVHRSKIKWNLATSTEFPIQYIKQHDFSLKNEPPFCLHFLMNHHLCIKPLVTIADAKCPTFLVMKSLMFQLKETR